MIKGTRILVGNEANEYNQTIESFRGCLHRSWI
jgi:hypothetical protein